MNGISKLTRDMGEMLAFSASWRYTKKSSICKPKEKSVDTLEPHQELNELAPCYGTSQPPAL